MEVKVSVSFVYIWFGGSHVVEGWIKPAKAGVFKKIDEGYHAARECAAFFTIETKRSGKLPSSARAERHNLSCRGKVILRFRQNFCAVFPA